MYTSASHQPLQLPRQIETLTCSYNVNYFQGELPMKLLLLSLCLSLSGLAVASPKLQTVDHVDIKKYMGKWYEIARYKNSFQRKCAGTTADYTLKKNGSVRVINTCQKKSNPRKLQVGKGTAFVTDKRTNSKLKVSFVPFLQRWGWFGGKYWIIELGENYEYAVVGEPKRRFLWILSRTKQLPVGVYSDLLQRLETVHHYDTSKLIVSPEFLD